MEPMEQPVPESNKTVLELYVTPSEAWDMWSCESGERPHP